MPRSGIIVVPDDILPLAQAFTGIYLRIKFPNRADRDPPLMPRLFDINIIQDLIDAVLPGLLDDLKEEIDREFPGLIPVLRNPALLIPFILKHLDRIDEVLDKLDLVSKVRRPIGPTEFAAEEQKVLSFMAAIITAGVAIVRRPQVYVERAPQTAVQALNTPKRSVSVAVARAARAAKLAALEDPIQRFRRLRRQA